MTETGDGRPDRPATERAEELVSRAERAAGDLAAFAQVSLRKVTRRVTKAAGEVWSEAQSVRRDEEPARSD